MEENNQLTLVTQLVDKVQELVKMDLSMLDIEKISAAVVASSEFNIPYEALVNTVNLFTAKKKEIDEKIKEVVRERYLETGEQSITTDQFNYTYVSGSVRETFDTKAFKSDNPEEYKKYVKTSMVNDSVKITAKKVK